MTSETLVWLIPLPPLLAFFLIVVFTNRNKALSHWLALIAAGLSWAISMVIFGRAVRTEGLAEHPFAQAISWLPTGSHQPENWRSNRSALRGGAVFRRHHRVDDLHLLHRLPQLRSAGRSA